MREKRLPAGSLLDALEMRLQEHLLQLFIGNDALRQVCPGGFELVEGFYNRLQALPMRLHPFGCLPDQMSCFVNGKKRNNRATQKRLKAAGLPKGISHPEIEIQFFPALALNRKGIDPGRKIGWAGVFPFGEQVKAEGLASCTGRLKAIDLRSTHKKRFLRLLPFCLSPVKSCGGGPPNILKEKKKNGKKEKEKALPVAASLAAKKQRNKRWPCASGYVFMAEFLCSQPVVGALW